MPFVHIELLEGRSQEAKEKMAQEIRQTISKYANAPEENIFVIFNDIKKENLFKVVKTDNR